jgi:hypothetical protein
MPRQHPRVLPRPPWRSRLAGWLRGFAESLDPAPDGLDLTGAPDFWAEHVRAAARRARKNGRVFRMRRWGVGESSGPDTAHVEPHHFDAPGEQRSRPSEPPGFGSSGAPARSTGAHTFGDPLAPRRGSGHRRQETPIAPQAHPAEQQPGPAERAVGPLVRPRHPQPPTTPRATSRAPGRPESKTPQPGSGRGDPPLVRPRSPATRLKVPVEPLPSATPTPPLAGDATPDRPGSVTLPRSNAQDWFSPPDVVPSDAQDWFSPPDVVPSDAVSGWPARTMQEPRREPPPAPSARVRLTESGEGLRTPTVTVPRGRDLQLESAVLPESLWPELPARRPVPPVMPDPAPILIRRERLAAEQAAT